MRERPSPTLSDLLQLCPILHLLLKTACHCLEQISSVKLCFVTDEKYAATCNRLLHVACCMYVLYARKMLGENDAYLCEASWPQGKQEWADYHRREGWTTEPSRARPFSKPWGFVDSVENPCNASRRTTRTPESRSPFVKDVTTTLFHFNNANSCKGTAITFHADVLPVKPCSLGGGRDEGFPNRRPEYLRRTEIRFGPCLDTGDAVPRYTLVSHLPTQRYSGLQARK